MASERMKQAQASGYDPASRLAGLDLLRFLLCACVVFVHFCYLGPLALGPDWPAVHLPALSILGYVVQGFFMISGFAIMYTIKGRTPMAFAIARIARMWPALAICSTITWLFTRHAFKYSPGGWQVINSWSFFPLVSHRGAGADWSYWTMTFEIRFYIFVFLAMLLADVHRFRVPLLGAWLLATLYDVLEPGNNLAHFLALDWYSGCFIIGALTFVVWEQRGLPRFTAAALLLPAFYATSLQILGEKENLHEGWRVIPMMHVTMWIVPVFMWALLVGSLMIRFPRRMPWIPKVAATLGAITYPLYLVHQLLGYRIINDLARVLPHGLAWLAPVAASAVAVAIALLVALWCEPLLRPLVQKLGAFLAKRLSYAWPDAGKPRPEASRPRPAPPMVHAE